MLTELSIQICLNLEKMQGLEILAHKHVVLYEIHREYQKR